MINDRIKSLRRVAVADLIDNPRNWRKHPDAQRNALGGLLESVGWADAVLARETDEGLMLIDGHLRKELAADSKVPVLVLDVTEAEADLILATHDPLTSMAETDQALLDELVQGLDIDNDATQKMLDELVSDPVIEVVEDEVPEVPEEPTTKTGDLFELGDHRLLCGDSTSAEDVARLMDGAKASLCFTSPPYGQQRDYDGAADVSDWDKLMNGICKVLPMADDGQVLVNLGLIHRDCEWIPYWTQWIEWMRDQGWRRFGWYVWDQGGGLPGDWNGRLAPSFEFVFHFNKQSVKPKKTQDCKHAGSVMHTKKGGGLRAKSGKVQKWCHGDAPVQDKKIPDSICRVSREKSAGSLGGHPAMFSVGFATYFIEAWIGLIYDPFLGSGTTLIAAEQLGRKCYGMEISPAYCDVIIQRWENLTGKKARKV